MAEEKLPELSVKEGFTAFLLAFAVVCVFRIEALRLPFFWDEAGFYAPYAQAMASKGLFELDHDLVKLFFVHPPLYYWLIATASRVLGFTPSLFRWFSFFSAAGCLSGAYAVARLWVKPWTAAAMAVALLCSPVMISEAGLAHPDLPKAALGLWALLALFRGRVALASGLLAFGLAVNLNIAFVFPAFAFYLFRRKGLLPCLKLFAPAFVVGGLWMVLFYAAASADQDPAEASRLFRGDARLWFSFVDGPLAVLKRAAHRAFQLGFVDGRWALLGAFLGTAALARSRKLALLDERLWALVLLLVSEWFCLSLFGATHQRYLLLSVGGLFVLGAWGLEYLTRPGTRAEPATPDPRFPKPLVPASAIALGLLAGAGLMKWTDEVDRFSSMEYRSAYVDHVRAIEDLAARLEARRDQPALLSRWPVDDSLAHPFLGYVSRPLPVTRLESKLAPAGAAGELGRWLDAQAGPVLLVLLDGDADRAPAAVAAIRELKAGPFAGGCQEQVVGRARYEICERAAPAPKTPGP